MKRQFNGRRFIRVYNPKNRNDWLERVECPGHPNSYAENQSLPQSAVASVALRRRWAPWYGGWVTCGARRSSMKKHAIVDVLKPLGEYLLPNGVGLLTLEVGIAIGHLHCG